MENNKVDHVTFNGIEYPVYCDLRVLDQIQQEFETITRFERELIGLETVYDEDGNPERKEDGSIVKKTVEPSIRAAVRGLYLMIREGQRIEAAQGIESKEVTEDDIFSFSGNFYSIGVLVHGIFMKCFSSKKKDEEETTNKKMKK